MPIGSTESPPCDTTSNKLGVQKMKTLFDAQDNTSKKKKMRDFHECSNTEPIARDSIGPMMIGRNALFTPTELVGRKLHITCHYHSVDEIPHEQMT